MRRLALMLVALVVCSLWVVPVGADDVSALTIGSVSQTGGNGRGTSAFGSTACA